MRFDAAPSYAADTIRFAMPGEDSTVNDDLGETAAQDTVEKRKGKTFISVEEFSTCCSKLSKTHIEQLKALGAFAGMADTSQITLFG